MAGIVALARATASQNKNATVPPEVESGTVARRGESLSNGYDVV
jgi:hypothetical protein